MGLNRSRIWLGGLAGGVVWLIWSFLVGQFIIGNARYEATQNAGLFLKQPRYPFFAGQWILILFVLAMIVSHLYAWTRPTRPGSQDGAEDWIPRRIRRGIPGKLRASLLVTDRSRVPARLDAGDVDRLDSSDPSRRMALQRLSQSSYEGRTCGGGRLARLPNRLDNHCRPISKHFRDALHDLSGVVAGAYDSISTQFGGVLQHQIKGFSTSFFTQIRQQRDVSAQDGLQSRSYHAKDRARANHDAADHSQTAHHAKSIQLELRGNHAVGDHPTWRIVADAHFLILLSRPQL
jgi:hypothetical protein